MTKKNNNTNVSETIEQNCPSKTNLLLADAIFIFHCIIILFVLFAPFTNIPAILILHITFTICLFVHWYANSNVCSLSIIEANLRGLNNREDTFTHKFIAPMYEISATEWSNIVWVITFIVMCFAIYKLYHTDKFKNVWRCYQESEPQETVYDSIILFIECIKPLFIID